jgi:anhydro-N-acetylmuramic acid kinase
MNDSIRLLTEIAVKKEKLIIGLMSGTSLDGLDIALCRLSGSGPKTKLALQYFKTVQYPKDVVAALQEVVSIEEVSLQKFCLLHSRLGEYHADLILEALREWEVPPEKVDCIASHGQSVYHAPVSHHQQEEMPNATLQIVDGDHIARKTGILTISDFRQKHTAAGGEGAPMVALTDEMLYRDVTQPRLLLNIGGIANFTWLPAQDDSVSNADPGSAAADADETITTDIGPGNTLIDQAMQELFEESYDKDGALAGRGTVQPELLKQLLDDPFFFLPMPRTTGPERFNISWVREHQQKAGIAEISDKDLVATLTWLSAQTIADAIGEVCGEVRPDVYLSGGGMHNRQLVEWIEDLLEQPAHSFAEIGFDPDAKEAACFTVLANELLSGEAFTISPKQNAGRRVNFGKISLPV